MRDPGGEGLGGKDRVPGRGVKTTNNARQRQIGAKARGENAVTKSNRAWGSLEGKGGEKKEEVQARGCRKGPAQQRDAPTHTVLNRARSPTKVPSPDLKKRQKVRR